MQVLKSRSFTKINLKRLNSNVERLFAKIGCLREIWLGFLGLALGEISNWAWLGFPKLLSLLPSAPSTHTCKHINIRVFFLFLLTLVFKEKRLKTVLLSCCSWKIYFTYFVLKLEKPPKTSF